jgi:succinate dehydrogenase and fumarate reductase iron-sulfur protein
MIVSIKRHDTFQSYEIDAPRDITVLELLHKIKEIDPTLSYRHMCRAGICGTCALKVNGKNVLACKTRLNKFEDNTIVLEPLDNAVVVKDLVVEHQSGLICIKILKLILKIQIISILILKA